MNAAGPLRWSAVAVPVERLHLRTRFRRLERTRGAGAEPIATLPANTTPTATKASANASA